MTTPPRQIEVISFDDPDKSEPRVRHRLRGRPKLIHERGVALVTQIINLEDALKHERTINYDLAADLRAAQQTNTRLSEQPPGLCWSLREQLKERDAWNIEARTQVITLQNERLATSVEHSRQNDVSRAIWENAVATAQKFATDHAEVAEKLAVALQEVRDMAAQCESYMVERDAARDKLAQAERALWHAQATRASNGQHLINTNVQLVAAQERLLVLLDTAGGGGRMPPGSGGGIELGAPAQPYLTPRREEDPCPALDHDGGSSAEAPTIPADHSEDEPGASVLLARDPHAIVIPLFNGGEPPDDDEPAQPPRRPVILRFPPAPPTSISSGSSTSRSAREWTSFESPSPRPAGATSPTLSHRSSASGSSHASSRHGNHSDRNQRRRREDR